MSEPAAESTDTARLAALLWSFWPGKAEQGQQIWAALDAELLPKRLYLSKAERLLEAGVGFDRTATLRDDEIVRGIIAQAQREAKDEAWDEAISVACDCGDFDGHPGDCAATPLIHAATRALPSGEGRA